MLKLVLSLSVLCKLFLGVDRDYSSFIMEGENPGLSQWMERQKKTVPFSAAWLFFILSWKM